MIPTAPQERPVAGTQQRFGVHRCIEAEVAGVAEATEGQREADEHEADEAEAEDGEVAAHHVSGVLLLSEAGLDECEAGLHEDDQDRADHHPQQVGGLRQRLYGCADLVIGFVGEGATGKH